MAKKPKKVPLLGATPEQLLGVLPKDVKRVDAPAYYASGINIMGTGNDFTLIFTRARIVENPNGTINQQAAIVEPSVIISVTPQTIKDLLVLMSEVVPLHEKEYGEIRTAFTKLREAASKKS